MSICGNQNCSSSTSVNGSLTFGYGSLDDQGYWEHGCRKCAENWDKNIIQTKKTIYDRMIKEGASNNEAKEYLATEEWLNNPAWPYNVQSHGKSRAH